MDFVDKIQTLLANGEICKSRLYFLKSQLESYTRGKRDERPDCLVNPDFTKIRSKLSKSFPSIPDVTKTQGFDGMLSQAEEIATKLLTFRSLVDDIVTFYEDSKELLNYIVNSILDFQMDKNRNIVIMFFDLLVMHFKVMWIFSTIDDKKVLFSLYEVASECIRPSTTVNPQNIIQPVQTVTKVMMELDNVHISLIHSFWSLAIYMRPLLLQFQASIHYAEDIDTLRDQGVFHPLNTTPDKIDKYASEPISATCSLSRYVELQDVDKYRDFVIFGCMVCPCIIADADILELFKFVCKSTLFVGLYRDMTFNLHMELEVLSLVFPLQDPSPILQAAATANASAKISPSTAVNASSSTSYPSGFKLKKILKELSRSCLLSCGIRSRHRRSYILSELTSYNQMISSMPMMIAPKLPQIIALTSFARVEIINIIRMNQYLSIKTLRKDTRKYHDTCVDDYQPCDDVVLLLSELRMMIHHVEKHADMIRSYYMEYLVNIDLKIMKAKIITHSNISDIYKQQFDDIIYDMNKLQSIFPLPSSSSESSPASSSVSSSSSLSKLRMNWDMITFMIYSRNIAIASKNILSMKDINDRMISIYQRSYYVDNISYIISSYMEVHDIWWFREKLIDIFTSCMSSSSSSRLCHASSSLVTFLPGIKYTFCHHNIPDMERIKLSVEFYMDDRMNDVAVHIIALMKIYWAHLQALENQVTSIEAARRLEKMIQYKTSSSSGVDDTHDDEHHHMMMSRGIDAPPGSESETSNQQSIDKLIDIHHRLIQTMMMSHHIGAINIFNREYSLSTFLRQRIISYVEEQLIHLFNQAMNDTSSSSGSSSYVPSIYNMITPKMLYLKIKTLCHASQAALSCIDGHISSSLRIILFKECCDLSLPPPGSSPLLSSSTMTLSPLLSDMVPTSVEYYGNLLWKVIDWFSKLCHHILSSDIMMPSSSMMSNDPPLIWTPFTRSFIRPTKLSTSSSSSSKTRGIIFNPSSSSSSMMGVSLEGISIETYLSRQELSSLCHIIGIQGVRVLEQELLNMMIEKIIIIKDILIKHQPELLSLYDDINQVFDVSRRLYSIISSACIALKDIGMLLAIRDILHDALHDVLHQYSSSMISLTKSASEMMYPYGHRQAISSYHHLAYDTGNTSSSTSLLSSSDIALAQSLSSILSSSSDRASLSLLPVLGSLLFLDESWKKASYIPQYDSFADNEHIISYALSKLFICIYGKETIVELDASLLISSSQRLAVAGGKIAASTSTKSSSSSASSGMIASANLIPLLHQRSSLSSSNRIKIAEYDMKIHSHAYLVMSSQILYMMKSSPYHSKAYPVSIMFTCLEHYTRCMPIIAWSDLHALVPNYTLHSARCDAAAAAASVQEPKRNAMRANSIVSQASSVN